MQYRHELKYLINTTDLCILKQRLKYIMQTDNHSLNGKYLIRSLYFDTLSDKALREKLDGVSRREKFRIRYYNYNLSYILLEKKTKINNLGYKENYVLEQNQVTNILNNNIDWMLKTDDNLLNYFYTKIKSEGLKPTVIVDYVREPFVYNVGNVRVTLDYNIRTSINTDKFLDTNCITIPINENPIILEVKWDNFLPDVIKNAIQLEGRELTAFSKYAQSRMFQ